MTVTTVSTSQSSALRLSDLRSNPDLQKLVDRIAAGQQRAQQMAIDFAAQQRKSAQAALARAQQFVLATVRSSKQMMALGGDMHGMVDMVDSALRMAQPAIRSLRTSTGNDPNLTKAVRDLANVAQEVGLIAQAAARDPRDAKRVARSVSALGTTLQQTRNLVAFSFAV
jgi:hypothetical protein